MYKMHDKCALSKKECADGILLFSSVSLKRRPHTRDRPPAQRICAQCRGRKNKIQVTKKRHENAKTAADLVSAWSTIGFHRRRMDKARVSYL